MARLRGNDDRRALRVGGALMLLVLLLGGGGLWLGSWLSGPAETQGRIDRTPPTPAPTGARASVETSEPTAPPSPAASTPPTQEPRTGVTPTPRPSTQPTRSPTRALTPEPDDPPTPRAAAKPGVFGLPTRTPQEKAYAEFWAVLKEAYAEADGSRLDEVMSGPILRRVVPGVEETRQQGRGVELRIKTTSLTFVDAADAPFLPQGGFLVTHDYVDLSRPVRLSTGRSLPRGSPPEVRTRSTTFTLVEGTYKVTNTLETSK